MKNTTIFSLVLFAVMAAAPGRMLAQDGDADDNGTSTATTVTSVTGTITQVDYDTNGSIAGFLLGSNVLLTFPTNVSGGIGTLGAAGNSVTYSGTAVTTSAGFQTVRVTSLTNNTTKATYSSATSTSTVTAYGPTSGTVKQLNYDSNGSIDAFIFTPTGNTTAVLVVTGSSASATLKPLLTVGATISVTGTTSTTVSAACLATGTLSVVEASSLVVGGQTIVITGGGNGGRGGRH